MFIWVFPIQIRYRTLVFYFILLCLHLYLFSPIIYSLCPMSKPNSQWYQHNYLFFLPYNVTSENIVRFIFWQFMLSSRGCFMQRMCFQIVLFKTTFDSSFLYGSLNQQEGQIFRYFYLNLLWNFRNFFFKN